MKQDLSPHLQVQQRKISADKKLPVGDKEAYFDLPTKSK
jgi:hypothetical protein